LSSVSAYPREATITPARPFWRECTNTLATMERSGVRRSTKNTRSACFDSLNTPGEMTDTSSRFSIWWR
jgi:hypothetical protein